MKKKMLFAVIVTLTTILLLSACSFGGLNLWSRLDDNDQEIADSRLEKVLEAIESKDKDGLQAMFSKNAIEQADNFDQSILELFDYYQGAFVSYDNWGGPGAEEVINGDGADRDYKFLESTYDIKTSSGEYRLAIIEFLWDSADEDNVGILSLYIIWMEDDSNPEYAYWGDGKNTPGINIGLKNIAFQ